MRYAILQNSTQLVKLRVRVRGFAPVEPPETSLNHRCRPGFIIAIVALVPIVIIAYYYSTYLRRVGPQKHHRYLVKFTFTIGIGNFVKP